jgi:hypothetical protein
MQRAEGAHKERLQEDMLYRYVFIENTNRNRAHNLEGRKRAFRERREYDRRHGLPRVPTPNPAWGMCIFKLLF